MAAVIDSATLATGGMAAALTAARGVSAALAAAMGVSAALAAARGVSAALAAAAAAATRRNDLARAIRSSRRSMRKRRTDFTFS